MKIRAIFVTALLIFSVCSCAIHEVGKPGQRYSDNSDYVEYIAGNSPIIISCPHGGTLKPQQIKNRTFGVTEIDRNSQDLARSIFEKFKSIYGVYPHLIINKLHRIKLDANRDLEEGAQRDDNAKKAWHAFHNYINIAKRAVAHDFGKGLFLDLHTHAHNLQRIELGYLLSRETLNLNDQDLVRYLPSASIRGIASAPSTNFVDILRGNKSFGSFLLEQNVTAIPSPVSKSPGKEPYFSGGFNTDFHGSKHGGTIDAIQVEVQWKMINTLSERESVAESIVKAVQKFLSTNYHIALMRPR